MKAELIKAAVAVLGLAAFAAVAAPPEGPEAWLEIMGGNVRKDGLRCDLEAIKDAGISGVHFFHISRGGAWPGCEDSQVPCLSEKWDDMVKFLGDECKRLGLALTVQNCPGWSQSGGPWVPLDRCMRDLAYARVDMNGGESLRLPEVPVEYRDADSDWHDVAVLAFPTPLGDDGKGKLEPISVETNGDERVYRFAEPVTVRTMTLPGLHRFNTRYGYHTPWMRVSLEAKTADGWTDAVRTPLPVSSWRDYVYTFTLACDERTSDVWRHRLEHGYPIYAAWNNPKFYSAARQTDWEAKSGKVLRSLLRKKAPAQDPSAWVDGARIADLTQTKEWKAPAGRWTVLRIGHVNSKRVNAPAPKEATGWECDKLDPRGIDANFAGYIGRLLKGPLNGKMYGMMVDSWECFGQTWTPRMEEYFRKANGYDVRKRLPALFGWVVDDPAATEKFLTDWRRTIGDLITKNYYGRMAKLAHEAGLVAYYETAFGDIVFGDLLEYWKYSDAPMCEYWYPHKTKDEGTVGSYAFKPIRPCASAAHIYGKNRVVAEAFTGMGIQWDEDFKKLQDDANRHFARGVTHLAFQSYTHAPLTNAVPPGGCMGGYNGTPFTRLQTWWKHMPEFTGWLSRCEKFLEAGLPSEDVLWYLGDAVDHKPDEDYAFPEGFRADYLNHDVLTNRLAVKDGLFTVPEGTSWKVLWVPDELFMLPATKAKLEELAAAGGKVVWGGKEELVKALSSCAKDVATEPALGDEPSEDFMWIHRQVGSSDRYFVAAGTNGWNGKVTFRAKGSATVFDPVSQERRAWNNGDKLEILPSRSVFVEFGIGGKALAKNPPERVSLRELRGWTLSFPQGWGAPTQVKLDRAASWTDIPGFSREARAFAGTAAYETEFDYDPAEGRLELDLGRVESMAKVFLNGEEIRTLWCEPFRCDLTRWAKRGKNRLKIEATNTWRNRIIYDLGVPEKDRKTWIIYQKHYNPKPADEFVPSGIVGPVMLRLSLSGTVAEFISPAERAADAKVAVFERRFENPGRIVKAAWSVTALGVFEAFVNGKPVGDDFLKPGATECGKCRHVYAYDVTGLLETEAGKGNVLSATVSPGWWSDEINRPAKGARPPWQLGREVAFRGELKLTLGDGSEKTVSTGPDWLASYSGPLRSAGIYEGEVYDARETVRNLKPAAINREFGGELRPAGARIVLRDDLAFKPAEICLVGGAEGATSNAFGKAKVLRRYRDGDAIVLDRGETLVVDFSQNCSAVPSFEVRGAAGTTVEIRHAEMLNEANGEKDRGNDGPAGTPYLANLRSAYAGIRYTLKDGEQAYRPAHSFFGYRYLVVTATDRVTFGKIRSTPVTSIAKEMECGSIITGNERVNKLISNIRWSMYSNYLSIPMDCPQRDERLGWTADTQVFMESAAYLADTYGFLSKYLADLRDAQHPDGLYPCFAPNVRHVFRHWASCGWTDAGVIIPYRIWKRYGKRDILEENWDAMVRYMDFLEQNAEPYRINHGDWLAFEHKVPRSKSSQTPEYLLSINGYFRVWMAQLMREMSAALGRTGDERRFAEQEKSLRAVFAAEYVGADGTIKDSYKGQCSDLYMLKLGLCGNDAAREATKADLIRNIRDHGNRLQTGFLGTAVLMPTLTFDVRAPELAYDLLVQDQNPSWLYSVDQGATTIWERWNSYTKADGFGPVTMNSFNHYAYGCVLEWLFSAAAGIRGDPAVPGFRRFILAPYPDRRLGSLKARYRSPAGLIESAWRYEDNTWHWRFAIPANTTAEVTLPFPGKTTLNGVPHHAQAFSAASGIHEVRILTSP